jgi:hypothetical protein
MLGKALNYHVVISLFNVSYLDLVRIWIVLVMALVNTSQMIPTLLHILLILLAYTHRNGTYILHNAPLNTALSISFAGPFQIVCSPQ